MSGNWGNFVDGRQVLRTVKQELGDFRSALRDRGTKVAIIHFEDREGLSESIRTRIKAAGVSTRAKLRTFRELGAEPIDIQKPWMTSKDEFTQTISDLNEDPTVAGIIVQHPMRREIQKNLNQIAPEKDLDTLSIREENPFQIPATSDAILRTAAAFTQSEAALRTVEPYLEDDDPLIAVVGAKGFVGSGIVEQLNQRGASVLALDAQDPGFTPDDLLQVADADIVISTVGQPVLDERHLRPHHRAVIDCGFSPIGDEVYGDVKKSAYSIPQNITPVPGGIGPTEMAILAERLIKKEVAPELESWSLEKQSYLSREEVAEFQQQWADEIYPIAQKLSTTAPGASEIKGQKYTLSIDSQAQKASIRSQDGRGKILEFQAGEVTFNNLNEQDIQTWKRISLQIDELRQERNADQTNEMEL